MTKIYRLRKKSRTPVHYLCYYFYDRTLVKGTIWELSETGWRATGERPVAAGSELAVCLTLPGNGKSKNILVDAAVVRWSEGLDAGWEITHIDEEARAQLDHFLENHNAPDVVVGTKKRMHSR